MIKQRQVPTLETVKPKEGNRTKTPPMTQSILKSKRGGLKNKIEKEELKPQQGTSTLPLGDLGA